MTKFQKYASLFIVVCLMILVTGVCCKISRHNGYKAGWNDCIASAVPDTVWRVDTIIHEQPTEVVKWKDKLVYVPIAQTDTVHHHDTTYVALQFEKKEYIDSTYKAVVSGFQPSLDWIEVYQRTQTITNYVEKYKYPTLIVSPAASVEILPMSVFAGAGIVADYWKDRFQISVEAGYGINGILGQLPTQNTLEKEHQTLGSKAGFYGKLGAKFNIIRK